MLTAMTAHFVVPMWCRAKSVVRMWCRQGVIGALERGADRARGVAVRRLLRQDLEVEAQFLGGSAHRVGALAGSANRMAQSWAERNEGNCRARR
ncbi:MAG: hypothetical protein ACLGIO_05770 [Acidimicrobiia bacterium]